MSRGIGTQQGRNTVQSYTVMAFCLDCSQILSILLHLFDKCILSVDPTKNPVKFSELVTEHCLCWNLKTLAFSISSMWTAEHHSLCYRNKEGGILQFKLGTISLGWQRCSFLGTIQLQLTIMIIHLIYILGGIQRQGVARLINSFPHYMSLQSINIIWQGTTITPWNNAKSPKWLQPLIEN